MKDRAKEYRLKAVSTPEQLEMQGLKTIGYGTKTICLGYFYRPDGNCYYAAVYEFTGEGHTCEDECFLTGISENHKDEGSALKEVLG